MLATFGVDVLEAGTTLRRVKVLLDRLPAGSWPDPHHELSWRSEAYLLAQLIDEVAALHYTTVRAHGGKPPRPKPFPRPSARPKPKAPKRSTWGELADALLAAKGPGVVVH